jgi:CheY-like chemotaxis protein
VARATTPEVILLDLRMPAMDGFEVLERLGQDPLTKDIPVIVCTSSTLEASERMRLARAAVILPKAVLTRETVASALAEVLPQPPAWVPKAMP